MPQAHRPPEPLVVRPVTAIWPGVMLAVVVLLLLLVGAGSRPASGRDCAVCGLTELPELAMVCPKCQAALHATRSRQAARATAVLIIEIRYTGDQPERLPEYGKVFFNGAYRGNLPLVEREARSPVGTAGHGGLGSEFTALYRGEWRNLDAGQIAVRVDMRFRRLFGVGRSYKEVTFPFVGLKSGEKTVLRYSFAHPREFGRSLRREGKTEPGLASGTEGLPLAGPARPARPAERGAVLLRTGSGTVGLEVPAFP